MDGNKTAVGVETEVTKQPSEKSLNKKNVASSQTVDQIIKKAEQETQNVNVGASKQMDSTQVTVNIENFDEEGDLDTGNVAGAQPVKENVFGSTFKRVMNFLRKFFFVLLSLLLGGVAVFYEIDFEGAKYDGIPVWRLMFYFAALYPSFVLSEIIFEVLMLLLNAIAYISIFTQSTANIGFDIIKSSGQKAKRRFQDAFLFLRRYRSSCLGVIWAVLALLAWIFAMSPYLYPNTNAGTTSVSPKFKEKFVLQNFENKYEIILRFHIAVIIYFFGKILCHFIVFEYLYQFSFKHYIAKTYSSIFHQTILRALAGVRNSRRNGATYLLPNELFKSNSVFDARSQNRLEHAAARYVLSNNLENVFAYSLNLNSNESDYVQRQLSKAIKSNVRKFERENQIEPEKTIKREVIEGILRSDYGDDINLEEAIKALDETNSNFITSKTLSSFVEKTFKDRVNLTTTLADSEAVTQQIKRWVQNFINILVLFITLIIFKINVLEALLTFATFFLGFSFVFGKTFSSFFENIVFLYAAHPYDVGDIIRLETNVYTVKRVLLQTTELESLAGEVRLIQNTKISSSEPLVNLTQSKGYWQESYFVVDAHVINDDFLTNMNKDMEEFVKQRPDIYQGYFRIDYCDFQPPLKVKLQLGVSLCITWATPGKCRTAQSRACLQFVQSLVKYGGDRYTAVVEFNPQNSAEAI